jgi:hypothetical protein
MLAESLAELFDERLLGRGEPEVVVLDLFAEWGLAESEVGEPGSGAHRSVSFVLGRRRTARSRSARGGSKAMVLTEVRSRSGARFRRAFFAASMG